MAMTNDVKFDVCDLELTSIYSDFGDGGYRLQSGNAEAAIRGGANDVSTA